MTVKRLLQEVDSKEISEWYAYDQRWPLPDHWQQTARICRTVMASSGNFKSVPREDEFIPAVVKKTQSQEEMYAELSKLKKYVKKE
tara:strand:+ start:3467 stop:3724 length:258 start_codon:yes stop_codon:yes gene_type:complete